MASSQNADEVKSRLSKVLLSRPARAYHTAPTHSLWEEAHIHISYGQIGPQVHTHVHVHTHICTHTQSHTCTHTHTCFCILWVWLKFCTRYSLASPVLKPFLRPCFELEYRCTAGAWSSFQYHIMLYTQVACNTKETCITVYYTHACMCRYHDYTCIQYFHVPLKSGFPDKGVQVHKQLLFFIHKKT